jgi:regulator of cell morphogenesis and NO signaling
MREAATNLATEDDESPSAWAERTASEIVAFILRRYHEPLHRDLPGLLANARRVEIEAHGSPLCPEGLTAHLEQVKLDLESHLGKEEKILFPLIVAGRGRAAFMPIKVMMAEHDDHGLSLARTRMLAHEFELPSDASSAWRALYVELQQLEADLKRHIDLENNVLFTRVMDGDLDNL